MLIIIKIICSCFKNTNIAKVILQQSFIYAQVWITDEMQDGCNKKTFAVRQRRFFYIEMLVSAFIMPANISSAYGGKQLYRGKQLYNLRVAFHFYFHALK